MPRFSANIDLLFTEHAFLDRFAAASGWNFPEVEILNPHAHDPAAMRAAAEAAGVEVTLVNTPIPKMKEGDRGAGVDPSTRERSQAEAHQTVDAAAAIGAKRIHVMAGLADPASAAAQDAFVEHVRFIADLADEHGILVMLEPLNPLDFPGYFLNDVYQALALRDRIARPNVFLQFDFYHNQIIHGDVLRLFRACFDQIGHIQIANPPDRREPGVGELDYRFILEEVDASGYDGPVSLEYRPSRDTGSSLAWAEAYGIRRGS